MKNFSITRIGVICLAVLMALWFSYIPAYAITDATHTNVEVAFIVYPDGTVKVFGRGNSTIKYSYPYVSPSIELNAQFSKIADKYNTLLNAKLTLPPDQAKSFPLNATTATINTQCENNITTTTLSASIQLCDSFGGMNFNSFPFNSTDLSITGNYADQRFNGTITIHLIPGLTLGDIHVNFRGNLTHVVLSDHVRVYYNYTMPIELNQTSIHWFLEWFNTTIPGTAEGSLYNMTGGMLICTTFNTTLTPIDDNCADVGFFVVIKAAEGDFIQLLSDMLKGGISIPDMANPYPLINATIYSVKNAGFSASYSKSSKIVTFNAYLAQNLTEWRKIYEVLPSAYLELPPYTRALLNTTYTSIYFSTETITYSNGQLTYNGNYTLTGDLNAQVNQGKNLYIDMVNATMPEWLINAVKNTDVDITNLSFSLKINGTFQHLSVENLKLAPPVNPINATAFKLENFFNFTAAISDGQEPPRFNEMLKLVVQGGSNGTHTVTVHFNPEEMPEPDEFPGENTLVWNNQSISKLKHLVFRVWEGKAESIYNPSLITPSNPYIINAEQVNCKLIINGISQSTVINIKGVEAPDVPPPGTYRLLGTCIQISTTENVTSINATLRIYYMPEQLSELGLDENSLKIFYFDEASKKWIETETQVNKDEHYAEAAISHLSLWALFGQPTKPLWQELWFLATIAIIAVAIIVAALLILRRKGKKGEA